MASPSAHQRWATVRAKLNAVYKLEHCMQILHLAIPDGTVTTHAYEHLEPVVPEDRSLSSMVKRASTKKLEQEAPFLPAALVSVTLGALSVVPYNAVLQGDPGSPLFISFILHLVVITKSLPKAGQLLVHRKISAPFHIGMVLLSAAFVTFKSDAYVRLPASLCMLLANLRMLIGVVLQFLIFRQRYSLSQLAGVLIVTIGIAWAGYAMQRAKGAGSAGTGDATDFLVGVLEMLASSASLVLLSVVVKAASARFGESNEEQMFLQHLCALPLVFPSQWHKVGPRFLDWLHRRDIWLTLNLAASVAITFAARSAAGKMASRSPNILMTQLVQTLETFMQLLIVSFMRVPPWPPLGFWGGTVLLVLGTVYYLQASDAPTHAEGVGGPEKKSD